MSKNIRGNILGTLQIFQKVSKKIASIELFLEAAVNLLVYILPIPIISVDKIGRVQVGIKPFLELSAAYNSEAQNCSLKTALSWGLQVSLVLNKLVSHNLIFAGRFYSCWNWF